MLAAVFVNLYESKYLAVCARGSYDIYCSVYWKPNGLSHFLAKRLRLERQEAAVFKNSVVLMNSGNYGIPVAQMISRHNQLV